MTPAYATSAITRCDERYLGGRKCSQIVLCDGQTVVEHKVFISGVSLYNKKRKTWN